MSQKTATGTVLSLSSQTVAGMVGNRVAMFVLQRMGHKVRAVPTGLNSNHGGYPVTFHRPVQAEVIDGLLTNLEENGWMGESDAVFTGIFSSLDQVLLTETWIKRMKARNPNLFYFCDPILGDDAPPGTDPESGGIYVPEEIARAVCERLMPLADAASPNRFELEYLVGTSINSRQDAVQGGQGLGVPKLFATSIPHEKGLANLAITDDEVFEALHPFLDPVPKGTGDVFAAACLGYLLRGLSTRDALKAASHITYELCRLSVGDEELRIIEHQHLFD